METKLKEISTQDLRDELALRGYFTENLWHINDVMDRHECDADEAMDILASVMENEWLVERIFEMICETIQDRI